MKGRISDRRPCRSPVQVTVTGPRSDVIAPPPKRQGDPTAQPRNGRGLDERGLRARAAAYRLHSLYDSRELTAKAPASFNDRFARQVDPNNELSEGERGGGPECPGRAYFASLAARSAQARRARRPQPRASEE